MKVSIKTLKGSSFEIEVDPSIKVRRAAALCLPLSARSRAALRGAESARCRRR